MTNQKERRRVTEQGCWKQNRLINATTEAVLEAIEELTFLDEGDLVGPTSNDVLQSLSIGLSLSEVEQSLAALTELGLLGTGECICNCGQRIYFTICANGVPLILHEQEGSFYVN